MAGGGQQFSREFSITSGSEDIPIKIQLNSLVDHLVCPVCRGTLHNTVLTLCGHRYCRHCIYEWVGRSHECPVCRSQLSQDDIFTDKQFDELMETIIKEKKKEEVEYFKLAAEKASEAAVGGSKTTEQFISPLEAVLRKHLKQTLQVHEVYHQQVIAECKKSQSRAHRDKQLKIEQVLRNYPHDPDHPERIRQLNKIEIDWEEKRKSLNEEMMRVETLLTSAYDRYLERNLPSPSTLPIPVQLTVPQKNFVANDVIIKPSDTMDHVLKKLRSLMKEQNMDVIEFPPCVDLEISLLSPFAPEKEGLDEATSTDSWKATRKTSFSGKKKEEDEEEEGLPSLVQTTLHGDCRPVLEYGLKPGSEIRIIGNIVLEGEQPRLCYAATFTKGEAKSTDYFICRSCNNTTWICQNCANVCHKEHDLIPHRMNHTSTWACCYCYRKTECQIFPGK